VMSKSNMKPSRIDENACVFLADVYWKIIKKLLSGKDNFKFFL